MPIIHLDGLIERCLAEYKHSIFDNAKRTPTAIPSLPPPLPLPTMSMMVVKASSNEKWLRGVSP